MHHCHRLTVMKRHHNSGHVHMQTQHQESNGQHKCQADGNYGVPHKYLRISEER